MSSCRAGTAELGRSNQVSADESAGAGYENSFAMHAGTPPTSLGALRGTVLV